MEALKPFLDMAGQLLTATGMIGWLLWQWWLERSERKEGNATLLKYATDHLKAENEMTAAINRLADRMGGTK